MDKILAYDSETGGLNKRIHSLLTLYLSTWVQDHNGKLILQRDLDLKIKPNSPDEPYMVTAGALAVNKIDLVKHDAQAITVNEAAMRVYNFLQQESNNGQYKLTPGGHNEPFDRGFVTENLIKEEVWRRFCDYHTLDTVPLLKALRMKGRIPKNVKLRLRDAGLHFGHTISDQDVHTAKGDTHLYVKVLESCLASM